MERLKTSKVSISNGNVKYPIGKSTFAVNLPLRLFHAIVAKSKVTTLHTFFKVQLVKLEQNRTVKTTRNFELFEKKSGFFKTILDKALTPFWKTFL